ncbi:MAG: Gfo/Idh/MocA family oxidoreductase [Chloroflexi bacterium]|nr:Gfo/Idh/MocA family oxidoreductase [Chloroflexota bacterium]
MVKHSGKLRVGIIGTGLQGRRRAEALRQFEDTKLIAVTSNLPAQAKHLAEDMKCELMGDWEGLVVRQDIDVVFVCTPPDCHLPMCNAALKNGKHVLCEKPLACNPEEAEQILALARREGLKLKCGFNHRHHPAIKQAREWFDRGLIGEPIFIRTEYGIGGRLGYEKDWRAHSEIGGGGQLMDQGMHVIDLSRWFLGDFTEVSGFLQTGYWDIAPLEDNAFCLLRTKTGQVASIHVSWTQWKNLFRFELYGKDGYITVEGLGGSYGVEKAILGKRAFFEPFKEEVFEFRGKDVSWEEEWREFKNAIQENREPMGDGHDGVEAVKIAYLVYEVARKSK